MEEEQFDIKVALEQLEKEGGSITPQTVVDSARDPDSPLHRYFEWDDSKAAEQHRLYQARALLRRVKIEVIEHNITIKCPAYVRDPDVDGDKQGYRNIASVRSESDTSRLVVIDEMRRLTQILSRAKTIAAALGFGAEIEQMNKIAGSVITRATARNDNADLSASAAS